MRQEQGLAAKPATSDHQDLAVTVAALGDLTEPKEGRELSDQGEDMFNVRSLTTAVLVAAVVGGGATAVAVAGNSGSSASQAAAHVVDVSTTEYKFNIETHGRIPAGLVELKLVNRGTMDHEAVLGRLHDGVTLAQFMQALKSRGPAALRLADFVGGAGAVAPNGTQVTWQALQGGTYVMVCLVTGPDGVPHLMKGMIASLTVTGHLSPAKLAALRPAGHVSGTVKAHDMTFTLPSAIDGEGLYRFADTDHADTHEFGIIRLNKGVTAADVVAWLKKPAGPPPFSSAGGFGPVPPGGGGWLRLDLAPGRYAAICFVPDNAPPHLPHALMGMVVAFTVTE